MRRQASSPAQRLYHLRQSLLQKTAEIEVASIQVVLTTYNLADAAIPPGLLLAEVGDEAFASQSCKPGSGDCLNGLAGNQCGQLAAEGGPQQAGSPFDHSQAGQGASEREGQLLPLLAADADAIDLRNFHHHLRVDCGCRQKVNARQWGHSDDTSADPAVALHHGHRLQAPLTIQQAL